MKTVSVLLLAILSIGCGGYSTPKSAPPQAGIVPAIAAIVPKLRITAIQGSP